MSQRIIAIGDLHGEATLLMSLIENLNPGYEDRMVFLGDYIDRGENTPLTIEVLRSLSLRVHCIFLRGNHEDMLLDHILGTKRYPAGLWEQNGGGTTLLQYRSNIPTEHLGFLMNTVPLYNVGNMLFVHAGFNPEKTLKEQNPHDLLWIREPWLTQGTLKDFDGLVIHGHTPTDSNKPEQHERRVNLDTGAFRTGILTAAICSETEGMRFVQISKVEDDQQTA